MSAASLARYLYYSRFSTPSHERLIYRWIKMRRPTSLVEVGIGRAVRSLRMIQVALRHEQDRRLHFTVIDPFEDRRDGCCEVTLKRAFRLLRPTGVRLRLLPGDAFTVLSQYANCLTATDLIVITADQAADWTDQAWVYVPRMLHERSLVLVERPCRHGFEFQRMHRQEVETLAAKALRSRRRAA